MRGGKKDGKVEMQTAVNSAGIPMPPSKKRKLGSEQDLQAPPRSTEKEIVGDDVEMEDASQAEDDERQREIDDLCRYRSGIEGHGDKLVNASGHCLGKV